MATTVETIPVTIRWRNGEIEVDPDPVECSVPRPDPENPDQKVVQVKWTGEGVEQWRVIFGSYAPVHEPSKVASPDNDTLLLVRRRPEDLGHWKYVVVALRPDGSLRHKDPEMIVDD